MSMTQRETAREQLRHELIELLAKRLASVNGIESQILQKLEDFGEMIEIIARQVKREIDPVGDEDRRSQEGDAK